MVCRGLLLMLHRAGEIELPPVRFKTLNPFVVRATPTPMLIDTTPIAGALKELRPIECQQVAHGRRAPVQHGLMEQHHYLKYGQPVRRAPQVSGTCGDKVCVPDRRGSYGSPTLSAPRQPGQPGPVYRLERAEARRAPHSLHRLQHAALILPCGRRSASGVTPLGVWPRCFQTIVAEWTAIRSTSRKPSLLPDVSANLLPGGQLATAGAHNRARQERSDQQAEPPDQGNPRFAPDAALPRVPQLVMARRRCVDVNLDGSDHFIDRGFAHAAESTPRCRKLKKSEPCYGRGQLSAPEHGAEDPVLPPETAPVGPLPDANGSGPAVMGRNHAAAFRGANKVAITHPTPIPATRAQSAADENSYHQKEPATLVRFQKTPLEATVFEMDTALQRLRGGFHR